MTPIEDTLRRAFHAKAGEIPAGEVPPLRLPARRLRSFSLAYGGGGRTGAQARRGWLAPAACAVLVAVMAAGSVAVSHVMHRQAAPIGAGAPVSTALQRQEAANRRLASAWVAQQVSRSAAVACDPAMCRALKARGLPARNVRVLGPTSPVPLSSALVIETPAVRRLFGSSLTSHWAPAIITAFGTGNARIVIRLIAPNGAAAYHRELGAELASRKQIGAIILRRRHISTSAGARKQLAAGQVDPRLLIAITALAAAHPVDIVDFGNIAAGASPGIPLRYADLAENARAARMNASAYLQAMLATLNTLTTVYRPARTQTMTLPGGQVVLRVEFTAPTPPGLVTPTSRRSP